MFRQESYFHYLFGVDLPDCFGALSFDGDGYKTVVFVPTWDEETATVCGESPDFKELAKELEVDLVLDVGDVGMWVEGEMKKLGLNTANGSNGNSLEPKLYLLKGLNTDSGNYAQPAYYKGMDELKKMRDEDTLFNCIAECRVHKVSRCISIKYLMSRVCYDCSFS